MSDTCLIKKDLTIKEFLKAGHYLENELRRRQRYNGGCWFSNDSMKFFSCRVSELMWQKGGSNDSSYKTKDIYFITSEADSTNSVRAFTIRKANENGDITTIGDFLEWPTLYYARKELKKLIEVEA
jgi:hypothetical protein